MRMWTSRSGPSKWALASMTFRADCSASALGAPPVASKNLLASQRRKPLARTGQVSRCPFTRRSAKVVASGAWNSAASCASSIKVSDCLGPRPRSSPASIASASSSAVTRQPARLSCARSPSNRARSSFLNMTRRSITSGANGAPGSALLRSTRLSIGSRISLAFSMAMQISSSVMWLMRDPPVEGLLDQAARH